MYISIPFDVFLSSTPVTNQSDTPKRSEFENKNFITFFTFFTTSKIEKTAKKGIYPKNLTMKGNPQYTIIDNLVLLVGPDAVLLELPPDQTCIGSLHFAGHAKLRRAIVII